MPDSEHGLNQNAGAADSAESRAGVPEPHAPVDRASATCSSQIGAVVVQAPSTLFVQTPGTLSMESDHARVTLLLEFLHQFDAPCPVCGYNLKALTKPICPECGQSLQLTVGVWGERLRLAWLFIALAPGFFSGICAAFVFVAIIARLIFGDGRTSIGLNMVDLFGWISGIFAIWLAANRNLFISQPRSRQRWIALLIWFIHIFAFIMMVTVGARYF